MFSRAAIRASKPSALGAAGLSSRLTSHARFISNKVVAGSKGRTMPKQSPRATAPANNAEATFTIKVRHFSHRCYQAHEVTDH